MRNESGYKLIGIEIERLAKTLASTSIPIEKGKAEYVFLFICKLFIKEYLLVPKKKKVIIIRFMNKAEKIINMAESVDYSVKNEIKSRLFDVIKKINETQTEKDNLPCNNPVARAIEKLFWDIETDNSVSSEEKAMARNTLSHLRGIFIIKGYQFT